MKRNRRRRYHTFVEKQKTLLTALIAVAVLDFLVSGISMKEIGRETEAQMQQLAKLHTAQVYEECNQVGYNMRRLLMENQDLTGLVFRGSVREKIYAKGKLSEKISYSFGSTEDYHFFFYFEDLEEVLSCSWLDMQDAKEKGIVDAILARIEDDRELTLDLYRWDYFQQDGNYYMLRAYRYNGVWFICYVPAGRLTDTLKSAYEGEDNQVILLSGDGEILTGRAEMEDWKITEEMLQNGGTWYRLPFNRIQIVGESSSRLGLSVVLVMRGYGGFSRIIIIQAAVFFTVLLTLLTFVTMNLYTKRRIIAPVQKFVKGLQEYQERGGGQEDLSVSDIHELEQINEQFRNFVHQIGALKISIYEEKLQRQKLETDHLKLQLKPHLFLNIMSIEHRLLETGKVEDAQKMCLAAIRYLRYLFSAGLDSISVKEAVAHIRDYLEIMELRYPREVEVDIFVEEAARECMIPPLILQTLVENSFKYGKQAGRQLEISITATVEGKTEEKCLCLNVSDNGRGFPEEHIGIWEKGQDLEQKDGCHIGIANIRARLAYAYGGLAGISLYNSPMGGAVVEIHIPLEVREETEDEHSASG